MNRKTLVRGGAPLLILIVLATGCGNSVTTPIITPSHSGSPIISMNIDHPMQGQFSHLAIYEDGYVIRNEERGLRMPVKEHPPTRSWYTGQLKVEEITNLIDFFQSSGFMEMDETHIFVGKPIDNDGMAYGDNNVSITISNTNLQKTVSATAYLTYADMPFPLNDIYTRLWGIALETNFVTSEVIQ